ncbi:MAG: hypothetical protein ACRERS_06620, partial [Methylococcales bacterium]
FEFLLELFDCAFRLAQLVLKHFKIVIGLFANLGQFGIERIAVFVLSAVLRLFVKLLNRCKILIFLPNIFGQIGQIGFEIRLRLFESSNFLNGRGIFGLRCLPVFFGLIQFSAG